MASIVVLPASRARSGFGCGLTTARLGRSGDNVLFREKRWRDSLKHALRDTQQIHRRYAPQPAFVDNQGCVYRDAPHRLLCPARVASHGRQGGTLVLLAPARRRCRADMELPPNHRFHYALRSSRRKAIATLACGAMAHTIVATHRSLFLPPAPALSPVLPPLKLRCGWLGGFPFGAVALRVPLRRAGLRPGGAAAPLAFVLPRLVRWASLARRRLRCRRSSRPSRLGGTPPPGGSRGGPPAAGYAPPLAAVPLFICRHTRPPEAHFIASQSHISKYWCLQSVLLCVILVSINNDMRGR